MVGRTWEKLLHESCYLVTSSYTPTLDSPRCLTPAAKPRIRLKRSRRVDAVFSAFLSLTILVATTGCDTGQYSAAVADFGVACGAVVQQTKHGYILVNETVIQQQVLTLALQSGPITTDPRKEFRPFLSDEDLGVRFKMLDALQAYAGALADLTGKTSAKLDSETSNLAASLQQLAGSDRLQKSVRETKDISKDDINAAASGLDAIGKLLVNRKIATQLPAILKSTEPKVEAIATVLAHEIGDVPSSADPGGLREKLWRTYDSLIENQAKVVESDHPGSTEKRQDVAKLAELVSTQRSADAALAATRSALGKLSAAHRALLQVRTLIRRTRVVACSRWWHKRKMLRITTQSCPTNT